MADLQDEDDVVYFSPAEPVRALRRKRQHEVDTIDLSSPTAADGPAQVARLGLPVIDSNNLAQPQLQLCPQQSVEITGEGQQVASCLRPSLKRLWGELGDEQVQQHQQPQHHQQQQQQWAAAMQWGGSGPRMPRTRVTPLQLQPSAASAAAAAAAQPLYTSPLACLPPPGQQYVTRQQQQQQPQQLPPGRRHALRWQQPRQPAHTVAAPAAVGSLSPAVVIEDSPEPAGRAVAAAVEAAPARMRSGSSAFAAALAAAAGAGPRSSSSRSAAAAAAAAPAAIMGNPRLGGPLGRRNSAGATATAAIAGGCGAAAAGAGARWPAGAGGSHPAAAHSGSSSSNSGSSSDADLARKMQEEEDAALARRLMEQEQQAEQREAAQRHRLRLEMYRQQEEAEQQAAAMAAAAAAAAAAEASGGSGSGRNRRGARAPARAAQQQEDAPRAGHHWGLAMAQALLGMPRFGVPGGAPGAAAAAGRGRGLPPHLQAMRDAMLGMQRSGLPPHLLFSDRDFTADDYDVLCRLDETVENRKGAAAGTIDALPTQAVPQGGLLGAAGEALSCAVCLEEFAEGAELRPLPCLHKFHKGCIDRWLGQKACCPICNREVKLG